MKPLFKKLSFALLVFTSGATMAQSFYEEKISKDYILTIGAGPSFAYLDNGGPYRDFHFAIKPSISVALSKKLTSAIDLRATAGYQYVSSGGNTSMSVANTWQRNASAFTAEGPAFYFDVIPSVNLVRFSNHMYRSLFNLYGGLGLGVLYSKTEQTYSYDSEEVPTKHETTTAYVPVRAGLSYRLGAYSDIAGEGTMMWTFTDNLDGNVGFNRFGDHLFQAQIVYRRYFRPKGTN